jgi:hypothetical protein
MIRISVAFNLLLFAFRYFNAILSSHVSFLFLFLLVFVLLVEGKSQGALTASLIPVLFMHM